jgi:hypothetical protein
MIFFIFYFSLGLGGGLYVFEDNEFKDLFVEELIFSSNEIIN